MRVLVFLALLRTYATQESHNTSKFFLTTPNNLLQEPSIHFNPNITHYDWSISDEHLLDSPRYDYKDLWWVTIRDSYKFFSDPPPSRHDHEKEKKRTTQRVTKSSTDINGTVANQEGDGSVRLKNSMTRIGKNIPNFVQNFNLHSKFDEGLKRGDPNSYLDNALKRNKQIQRMLEEVDPRHPFPGPPFPLPLGFITGTTAPAPGVKVNAMAALLGLNRDLNITYNKIVENFQVNVGENNVKNLFGLGVTYHPSPSKMTDKVLEVGMLRPVDRQGSPPKTTANESVTDGPEPEEHPPEATVKQEYWWITTTARPANVIEDLKRQKNESGAGYFSMFLNQCALVIPEKSDGEVRLLALALEKEYHVLINQDKYILSFGQPFLSTLEAFTTKVAKLPPNYIKHRAMLLHFIIEYKALTDVLYRIILDIDSLFKEDEGLALFKVVELLTNYPNTTEDSYGVLRAMSSAVFAPYKRLSGTVERQILTESINDYLRSFHNHLKSRNETEFEHFNHMKHVRRRFNNRTRFTIVNRDNKIKAKVKLKNNLRLKKTTERFANCFDKSCLEKRNTKYKDVNKITDTSEVKDLTFVTKHVNNMKRVPKKQAVTRFPPTMKYPTNRQKDHSRDEVKQNHIQIRPSHHNKTITLKKDVQKKQREQKILREFKNRYHAKYKAFVKMNGHDDKDSKTKAEKFENKLLSNLSETDDVTVSNETEYYSDYDSDDSAVSAEMSTTSKINLSRAKNSNSSNDGKIAKSLNKPIATDVTVRNQVQFGNSTNTYNQTIEFNRRSEPKRIIKRKPVKTIKEYKNVNKLSNKKIKTFSHSEDISESNVKYVYRNQKRTIKPSYRNTSATVKNKIADQTSYSDEEDLLKFKISDAMRHDKEYFKPLRRSYHVPNKSKKGINDFTSYSSEEVILKSNIYKTLGFDKFNTQNKAIRRANDDDDFKTNKIRLQKFRPINEMSSYSDEKCKLKEKLYV